MKRFEISLDFLEKNKMAGIKRNAKEMYVPRTSEILLKLDDIGNLRTKALVCILYLTGARISEIVGRLRKKQIYLDEFAGNDLVRFSQLEVLKKKRKATRDVVSFVKLEKDFLEIINDYLQTIEEEDAILFPITRERAWQLIKRHGYFPHFFRHARATNLNRELGFSAPTIKEFFDWSDWKMAMRYTHSSKTDVSNAMAMALSRMAD